MTDSRALDLRNLEPRDEEVLASIGITSRAQFDRIGADKAYLLLLEAGHAPNPELLHRLRGVERDIDWKILAERDKRHTKSRFLDVDEP